MELAISMADTPCNNCRNLVIQLDGPFYCMALHGKLDVDIARGVYNDLPPCPEFSKGKPEKVKSDQNISILLKVNRRKRRKHPYTMPTHKNMERVKTSQEIIDAVVAFHGRTNRWPSLQQIQHNTRFRSQGYMHKRLAEMVLEGTLKKIPFHDPNGGTAQSAYVPQRLVL